MCRETSSSRAPSATQKSNIHILFGHARWVKLTHSISSDMWHVWAEIRVSWVSWNKADVYQRGGFPSESLSAVCVWPHSPWFLWTSWWSRAPSVWLSLSLSLSRSIYLCVRSSYDSNPVALRTYAGRAGSCHTFMTQLFEWPFPSCACFSPLPATKKWETSLQASGLINMQTIQIMTPVFRFIPLCQLWCSYC